MCKRQPYNRACPQRKIIWRYRCLAKYLGMKRRWCPLRRRNIKLKKKNEVKTVEVTLPHSVINFFETFLGGLDFVSLASHSTLTFHFDSVILGAVEYIVVPSPSFVGRL